MQPAKLVHAALKHDLAEMDDGDMRGHLFDFGKMMRGNEHCGTGALGQCFDEVAHLANADGIEPVGRFVEDQQLRPAEQRPGEPETMAHAERIFAHMAVGDMSELDRRQHAVDFRFIKFQQPSCDVEIFTASQMFVMGRGFKCDAYGF